MPFESAKVFLRNRRYCVWHIDEESSVGNLQEEASEMNLQRRIFHEVCEALHWKLHQAAPSSRRPTLSQDRKSVV